MNDRGLHWWVLVMAIALMFQVVTHKLGGHPDPNPCNEQVRQSLVSDPPKVIK